MVGRQDMNAGGILSRGAFTLVELLAVISIISLLMSILLPALSKAKWQARRVLGMSNQRAIVQAANLYAADNGELYPESVATIGPVDHWNWQEPMMMTGYRSRSPRVRRSMSGYLHTYLDNADTVYCPSAPRMQKYHEEAWRAGDAWDNPDTGPSTDPLSGTYCFFWNYTGYLEGKSFLFRGPRTAVGGRGQSTMLVSDYFGYDHYRSRNAYGSCERLARGSIIEGTWFTSPYWSDDSRALSDPPNVKLHAGYSDGHVEGYAPRDTVAMRVVWKTDTGEPYPPGVGFGIFYLPRAALH